MSSLKFAFRSLVKTPLISGIAILSLALGIGANSAIFSVMENILLRTLPVQEPARLANLCATGPLSGSVSTGNPGRCVFSYPMLRDLQEIEDVFAGVAGYRDFGANLAYRGDTLSGGGMSVSGNYFPVLGVRPALGRLFDPQDDVDPGAHQIVVLSHRYWTDRFAQDRAVLNDKLIVNGQPLTIVGVAGQGFKGTTLGDEPEVFIPLSMREAIVPEWEGLDDRQTYWVYSFARLAEGHALEQAEVVANQRYRQIIQDVELPIQNSSSESYLERFGQKTLELESGSRGQSGMISESKTPLFLLLGVTGLVLLIACANVANLLLTKAVNRSGEIALRMSLGARRMQVVGQLLTESLMLSVLGGIVGFAVARLTLAGLSRMLPASEQSTFSFEISGVTFLFMGVLTLVTSLVGLFPALKATRPDLAAAMKAQTNKASGSRSVIRFRTALAILQIGMSMALLVSSGLFIKSLVNVSQVDLGIDTERLALFTVAPELNGYSPAESKNFFARVEEEVAVLPGVSEITASMVPLLGGSSWGSNVEVQGYEAAEGEDTTIRFNAIGPGYFSTLGTPLISGREFALTDELKTPEVGIVNETFARRFELGREAVGRRMQMGSGANEFPIEIVGLVEDAKYANVKDEVPPMLYLPYRQDESVGSMNFYVRAQGDPSTLLDSLRSTVSRLDPALPIEGLGTFAVHVEESLFIDSLLTKLSVVFALLATLLAAIGLYGTLAYSVAQRSGEIGLRMALGADGQRVRRMILGQVGKMTLIGTLIGLAAAYGLGRAASSLLFELRGDDPAVFALAAVLLVAVAITAGMVPAMRASRIEPMTALRDE